MKSAFLLHFVCCQMHIKYISVRYIISIHNFSILTLKCSVTVPSWLLKIPNIFTSRRDSRRELTSAGSKEHLWELCTCLDTVTGRRLNRKSLHMMDVSWRSPVLDSTSFKALGRPKEISRSYARHKTPSNQRSKLNSVSLAKWSDTSVIQLHSSRLQTKVSEPFFSLPLCEQQSCAFGKKHWLVSAHETSCPPSAFHRGHREVTSSANKLSCSSAKGC